MKSLFKKLGVRTCRYYGSFDKGIRRHAYMLASVEHNSADSSLNVIKMQYEILYVCLLANFIDGSLSTVK